MRVRKEKDVVIIELLPDDLTDAKQLCNVMEKLLLEDGERKIVADLTRVDSIYSLQIGSLVTMHVMCYENVAVMKLAGANEKVKNLLRMVGLETMMEMHHGPEVAAQSFGAAPPDGPRIAPQPRVRK
jgi:anti-anti-sigma factor